MTGTQQVQRERELARFERHFEDKPEGPVSAAIIAGGVGAFTLGLLTTVAEANETIKGWLELKASVGPLAGKTVYAVGVWLISWILLHGLLRTKPYETRRAFTIAIILIVLGVVGTFPTFFQAFAVE